MGWRTGQSYAQDLRDRVLWLVDGGMPVREAAVIFKVSLASIYKARIRASADGRCRDQPEPWAAPAQAVACAGTGAGGPHPLATGDHAGTGAGLASGGTWCRTQHRRDVEHSQAARSVV